MQLKFTPFISLKGLAVWYISNSKLTCDSASIITETVETGLGVTLQQSRHDIDLDASFVDM